MKSPEIPTAATSQQVFQMRQMKGASKQGQFKRQSSQACSVMWSVQVRRAPSCEVCRSGVLHHVKCAGQACSVMWSVQVRRAPSCEVCRSGVLRHVKCAGQACSVMWSVQVRRAPSCDAHLAQISQWKMPLMLYIFIRCLHLKSVNIYELRKEILHSILVLQLPSLKFTCNSISINNPSHLI